MIVRQRFKSAIKRGTGEAYLLMKAYPHIDFSCEIIKAALKNLSYDNQCESRDEYVFGLIERSPQKEKIRQVLFQVLATGESKDWDFYQLCNIVGRFAKQGEEEARKAIYQRYDSDPFGTWQTCDEEIIVELDGIKGLKRIAETQGKILQENGEVHITHWSATNLQERCPQINVLGELAKAAETNSYIKAYVDAIVDDKENRPKIKREPYSYETINKRIEQHQTVRVADKWKKELSQTDIHKLADDLLKQTERKKIAAYLPIFCTVKWPYDYQHLLKYAHYESMQHKKWRSKNWDMLVEKACDALKFFSGADIRELAMKKLNTVRFPREYMSLLVKNYKKGDAELLSKIIMRCKNDDEIHSIAFGVIEIYESNKTKECKEPLEAIYERINCGLHRKDIVQILIKNKVFSEKIKREIQFDSEEETRKLWETWNHVLTE